MVSENRQDIIIKYNQIIFTKFPSTRTTPINVRFNVHTLTVAS